MIRIKILDNEGNCLDEREFTRTKIVIGRHEKCDLQLKEPSVSGRHASISVEDNKLILKDLNSSNGVYVNKRRVLEEPVEGTQKIRIGRIQLLLESDEKGATPPETINQIPDSGNPEVREFAHITGSLKLKVNHEFIDRSIIFFGRYWLIIFLASLVFYMSVELFILGRALAEYLSDLFVLIGVILVLSLSFIAAHYKMKSSIRWRLYLATFVALLFPLKPVYHVIDYIGFFDPGSRFMGTLNLLLINFATVLSLYIATYILVQARRKMQQTYYFIKFGYLGFAALALIFSFVILNMQPAQVTDGRKLNDRLFMPVFDSLGAGESVNTAVDRLKQLNKQLRQAQ